MALTGTVHVPGIGSVPKKGAVYGTLAIVVVGGGIILYRRRHPAAAASTTAGTGATVTDPAAQQQISPFDTGQLGGGLSGYYYGTGRSVQQSPPGPGNFADNAEWSQYVINYMVQTLNGNAGQLGEAIGKYLEGQPVTEEQRTLLEEAIAIGGRPPQAGPRGYPPNIRLETTHPKPNPKRVKVPDVQGEQYDPAREALQDAGLKARAVPRGAGIVAFQVPKPGREADRGSTVTLHMAATG